MVDIARLLVAAAPFVVAGVVLVGLRRSATISGVATLAAAVLTTLAGAYLWSGPGAGALYEAFGEGAATSAQVLYVLFGGLLLYNLLRAGGAVDEVSGFLGRVEPDGVPLAVLVVVGVGPFFESVTGFGVAVVISAPILLAAGFSPLRAAVLASWGQCAVPWGALGVGTVIGSDLSGMSFGELSDTSALLSLPLFVVFALSAAALAGGAGGLRRRLPETAALGLAAGLGTLMTSLFLVPELSGAAGGLCATALFVARRRGRIEGGMFPVRSLAPYALLLALLAATSAGPVAGSLEPLGGVFSGPGTPLLISGAFAAALFGLGFKGSGRALRGTLSQWLPTAGAVLTFVLAGQVVAASGAAGLLAFNAASLGPLYPLAAPVFGALGGVLAGSNAASNALFMPLQVESARALGEPVGLVAAVQNVAGSQASLLAPQRVVLAATATGLIGREGEIVRASLPPVIVCLGVLAAVGFVL
jgi:lactate permease